MQQEDFSQLTDGQNRPVKFYGPWSCGPQEQETSLSGLLHQAALMMQAARHRRLPHAITGGQLVSVIAGRNVAMLGFPNSRT